MILETSIQAIKEVQALDIIGHYVNLKSRGANYVGLCPFHDERSPSFYVSPARNSFKCFGCGVSGDAIKFVREYEGKGFVEAVELIAGLAGIQLEAGKRTERTQKTTQRKITKRPVEFDVIPESLILTNKEQDIYSNPLTAQYAEIFGANVVKEVLSEYSVTVHGSWLTYPQIDCKGRYRTGKAIRYSRDCHRDSTTLPLWLHSSLINKGLLKEDFKLKQCFTGEALIAKYPARTVAIVEGQSTMLFMACLALAARKYKIKQLEYFDQFTWICTGGSDGIGWKGDFVTEVLRSKTVILFPDAGFYSQWFSDAEIMQEIGLNVGVSDLIEHKFLQGIVKKNQDLRDYFKQHTNEIKSLCNTIEIDIDEIDCMPATLKASNFGDLISQTIWLKDGRRFDVLFDPFGEPIKEHPQIKPLSEFFNKTFLPGKLAGMDCLINIESN